MSVCFGSRAAGDSRHVFRLRPVADILGHDQQHQGNWICDMKGCSGSCKQSPAYTLRLTLQKPNAPTEASGQEDVSEDDNWARVMRVMGRFITRGGGSTTLGNRESRVFQQIEATTTSLLRVA